MKYRQNNQMLITVLEHTQQKTKITDILRSTNTNYTRLKHVLGKLIESEMMRKITYDGKNTFVLTDKGRIYLSEYKKYNKIIESFGLDL